MATQIAGISPTNSIASAPPPQTDPKVEAARILNETRIGNGDNAAHRLNFVEAALDKIADTDPALAASVRAEVIKGLSPTEQGQLLAITDGTTRDAGNGQTVTFAAKSTMTQEQWIEKARAGGYRDYAVFAQLAGSNDNAAILKTMDDVQNGRITPSQFAAAGAAVDAAGASPDLTELGLDLTQMTLDVVGIFDQTGISDGANALISAGRRDWVGAGLSLLAIVPVFGALAAAGKLGKWAKMISHAIEAAASNNVARKALEPALRRIHDALKSAPEGVLKALPDDIRKTIEGIRTKLDDFFGTGAKRIEMNGGKKGDWPAELNAKALEPNAEYIVNGYKYVTDAEGRVTQAAGKLDLKTAERNGYQQSVSGRTDRLDSDQGGHLIASIFNGPGDRLNLVPMDGNFNMGAWRSMESKLADALKAGKSVEVKIQVEYAAGSQRPTKFIVEHTIDGKTTQEFFRNQAGGR